MTVFAKGAWYALDTLCESGYQTIGLDWTYDPAEACKVANGRVTLQGNMDPNVLYGGRKAITENVERMLEGFKGAKGRYIINLGHGESIYCLSFVTSKKKGIILCKGDTNSVFFFSCRNYALCRS